MAELGRLFPPPPWLPGADSFYDALLRSAQTDVATRLMVKEKWKRVPPWLLVQQIGGSGLAMATELRKYVQECANRLIEHGSHSLPASFNVIEAFLNYETDVLLFGLRNEKEHLLSADDYFTWYSTNGLPRDPKLVSTAMEEGVVYSYNMASEAPGYRIAGRESSFVLAGVSFVRHDHELSCILLAGEQPANPPDAELAQMEIKYVVKGKENVRPHPSLTNSARYLECHPGYSRVILLTRLDLRARTHDVRYVALDVGPAYLHLTDDPAIWEGVPAGDQQNPDQVAESLRRYDELLAALGALIYLPIAFADMSDRVKELEFPTELQTRSSEAFVKKAVATIGILKCPMCRKVRCLQSGGLSVFEIQQHVQPPDMEFQTEGFWRSLAPAEVGTDRDRNPIIGRTWVTRHESWTRKSLSTFLIDRTAIVPIGSDPGTVYVMRSPGHAPNVYKIGVTRRTADTRAAELGRTTGVPLPFAVVASWVVGNCGAIETECHIRLNSNRINPNREFFYGELREIVAVIADVVSTSDRR